MEDFEEKIGRYRAGRKLGSNPRAHEIRWEFDSSTFCHTERTDNDWSKDHHSSPDRQTGPDNDCRKIRVTSESGIERDERG